jgi:amino acid permease
LLVTLFVVPTCCIRNYGHLAFISYISISAITGTIVLVLFGGPANAPAHRYEDLNMSNMKGSLETIGSVVFAFNYASAVFHSYIGMRRSERTVEKFARVAVWTTSLGVCMCFVLGLVGYLSFRNDVDADILENFSSGAGTFFKVVVILHLILYIPGDFLIMRYSFFKLLGLNATTASDGPYFGGTFFLIALATLLACLIQLYASSSQSLSMILDLTGGISGSMVSFILPGLMAMRLLSTDAETYLRGLLLVIFGSIVPVLVLLSNIMKRIA